MIGTTMDELREKLFNGHEVEFTYNNREYSIEPELVENDNVVQIWICEGTEPKCILTAKIKKMEDVDLIFKEKCFGGKSFNDIEAEITVDTIF